MASLSERIKLSRAYSGLSLDALSEKIGVTTNSLKNYIKNSKNVTVETGQKIASICGVDLVWLLTGQGEMINPAEQHLKSDNSGVKFGSVVEDYTEIVKNFEDHEAVREINQDLLIIERNSIEAFEKARNIIKGIKEGVSIKKTECDRKKKTITTWSGTERRKKAAS